MTNTTYRQELTETSATRTAKESAGDIQLLVDFVDAYFRQQGKPSSRNVSDLFEAERRLSEHPSTLDRCRVLAHRLDTNDTTPGEREATAAALEMLAEYVEADLWHVFRNGDRESTKRLRAVTDALQRELDANRNPVKIARRLARVTREAAIR